MYELKFQNIFSYIGSVIEKIAYEPISKIIDNIGKIFILIRSKLIKDIIIIMIMHETKILIKGTFKPSHKESRLFFELSNSDLLLEMNI
tara:strand:+ start:337 stop:603 length:267 start_codon:yes stop_codon:yes gene_type:complete